MPPALSSPLHLSELYVLIIFEVNFNIEVKSEVNSDNSHIEYYLYYVPSWAYTMVANEETHSSTPQNLLR